MSKDPLGFYGAKNIKNRGAQFLVKNEQKAGPALWGENTAAGEGVCDVGNSGSVGETYIIGGKGERTNLQVAHAICDALNEVAPNAKIGNYRKLITFVTNRAGQDFRYPIDATKIETELNWKPAKTFESGLKRTVKW